MPDNIDSVIQQNTGQQQSQPVIQADIPRRMDQEYSDAHYKFLASLIESVSAREIFTQIANTDFSQQCILGFHKLITANFDKNAMLALNENIELRIIDFEIAQNLHVLECYESDIQNPAFLTFSENILSMFRDFISRSKNAEERKRLLRTEYGTPVPQQDNTPFGMSNQNGYGGQQGGFLRR